MIKKIIRSMLDIVYPPQEAERSWRNKHPSELARILPVAQNDSPNICALFSYKNATVRDIIWSLKYDGNIEAAHICAVLLYDVIVHELTDLHAFHAIEKPILLPIPLSPAREKERGFNQCARIAEGLEKLDNDTYFTLRKNILTKQRDTPSQTKSQGKYARAENLRDCFRMTNRHEIQDKDVIIIDDVFTTGSTLAEATRTLQRAGARKILCFTFAH